MPSPAFRRRRWERRDRGPSLRLPRWSTMMCFDAWSSDAAAQTRPRPGPRGPLWNDTRPASVKVPVLSITSERTSHGAGARPFFDQNAVPAAREARHDGDRHRQDDDRVSPLRARPRREWDPRRPRLCPRATVAARNAMAYRSARRDIGARGAGRPRPGGRCRMRPAAVRPSDGRPRRRWSIRSATVSLTLC
jgi:hypothetical protein